MTEKIFGSDEFREDKDGNYTYCVVDVDGDGKNTEYQYQGFILHYKGSYSGHFGFGNRACFFEIIGGEWDGIRVMIAPEIINKPWVKFWEEWPSISEVDSSYYNLDIAHRIKVAISKEKERLKKWGIE